MSPTTQPAPIKKPAPGTETPSSPPGDGTNQLLKSGSWTLATGIILALITKFFLGGIGPQGPHTNSGWMALIIVMMCLPFGFLLFLLGALKWLRNRRAK